GRQGPARKSPSDGENKGIHANPGRADPLGHAGAIWDMRHDERRQAAAREPSRDQAGSRHLGDGDRRGRYRGAGTMKVRYDNEVNALYVPVRQGVPVARSVVVDANRVVDLDASGQAVGIEVLGASHGFQLTDLADRYGLAEFAEDLLLVETAARPPKHR